MVYEDEQSSVEVPVEALEALSQHPSRLVRQWAAADPRASVGVLIRLTGDQDAYIRAMVAENPAATAAVLQVMAEDEPDVLVRCAIARNRRTPPSVLVRYAWGTNNQVRRWVARNPNTPEYTLADLAQSGESWDVRVGAAMNPHMPPERLRRLACDEDFGVREAVASNPRCPPEVLAALAADSVKEVRGAVASNPRTPGSTLAALATNDPELAIRQAAAMNPSVPARLVPVEAASRGAAEGGKRHAH